MQALISNFRGVQTADLDITNVCLVAGPNGAGKTSTAQAVAAALTGEPMPIKGISKSSCGQLVRSGAGNGSITLTGDNGHVNIIYPSAKVKTEGQAPFASTFAAGMQSIVNLEEKERIKILTEYLGARPTRADLDKSLAEMKLPVEMVDSLWKLIEQQGWENTHANIKEKGTKLKGQWEAVTNEKYGSRKGESWIPEGYEPGLESQSEDTLKALVTDANDSLEAAIAGAAVEEFKADGLAELAALVDERQAAVDGARAIVINTTELDAAKSATPATSDKLATLRQAETDLIAERNAESARIHALPKADNRTGIPCPACGVALEVHGVNLTVLETMSEEEKAARIEAVQAGTQKLNEINERISVNQREMDAEQAKVDKAESQRKARIETLQQAVNAAENEKSHAITMALRDLAESIKARDDLAAASVQPQGAAPDVDRFRTLLQTAQTRLKAFQCKHSADKTHTAICQNQELANKTAPDGIRGDVLARELKGFNQIAEPICATAGWGAVALESDFTPTYGGTQYLLLSESEKWRVRVVLQMVMARYDKSEALVIDAADILDKGGRNGLFKACLANGLPTLVCMTIDSRELVPNLGKAGYGSSYWMMGGVGESI